MLDGPFGVLAGFGALILLVVLFFSMMASSPAVEVMGTIKERGTIVVGVLENELPFSQLHSDGTVTGFEGELATLVGESVLGSKGVQYLGVNAKNARAHLDNGDCDLLISKVSVNATNTDRYQLSLPYLQEQIQLLIPQSVAPNLSTSAFRIGVIRGSDAKNVLTAYLAQTNLSATVVEIPSYPEAVAAIAQQKLDALCAPNSVLQPYVTPTLTINPLPIGYISYAIAVRAQNHDLFDAVEKALAALTQSGDLARLYASYHLSAPTQ